MTADEFEKWCKNALGLDLNDQQRIFLRATIKANNKWKTINQEYPADPDIEFLPSGLDVPEPS